MASWPCRNTLPSRQQSTPVLRGATPSRLKNQEVAMSVLDAFSLSGKVSVVTGANRGIGRALAIALAEAGSDVVLLVRDIAGSAEVLSELERLGVVGIAVTADVTEADQVRRAVDEVLD